MKKISFYAVSLSLLIGALPAISQVRLPKLVSDGMVLQRDTNVRLWGWASPGEEVTIRFLGKTYATATKADGDWSVMLSPMKAGGPYSMEIDASNHIVLNNIMIGDVWVCSGQSNMQLPMIRVRPKYRELIAHSENPDIREFIVPNMYNFEGPQKDLPYGQWESENPWSIIKWSAVSYFFARNLWEKYHVPIGLINSSVGGTPIQSWMSTQALKDFPAELKTAADFGQPGYIDSVNKANNAMNDKWYEQVWKDDKGLSGETPWCDPSYDDAGWSRVEIPSFRGTKALDSVNGVVWFRREFNVPASLAGKQAKLIMGRIVNADYDYVNGVFVGSISYQYPPRRYKVAPGILKAGRNTIVVRVIGSHDPVQFITDKPYELVIGNHKIHLAGEWRYKIGTAAPQLDPQTFVIYEPTGCYNAMIVPLLNYTIKGAIWYQGESNCGDPAGYGKMFDSMIADWRQKWGEGNFPFLFVQLPNYGPAAGEPGPSGWADVRNAQLGALALPNTGMAVTYDIGEWNDIHPLDKGDVGKRLALAAEKVAYGDNHVVYSGPIYKAMKIEGSKIVVSFTDIGTGLMAKDGPLKQFQIAGKDGKYVWAKAKISGNKVVVWSQKVSDPVSVRYAWADNPAGANLYNKEGLPASPFETEMAHR
ncbi:MAG: sialate O-acetylesterase [Bacteroidetes bacterium]|nr:sialate O-acetylesterase [Bacteroidota bacterium]